jgi:hypothetical protein
MKTMKMDKCKNRLLTIWGFSFLGIFIVLLVQSFAGKYGDRHLEVTGWFVPLMLPTLLLMIGVFIADAKNEEQLKTTNANQTLFKIAEYGSIFYILLIYLVFFLEPFFSLSPFEMMTTAKPFLSIIDSVLTGLIGYFFVKK